MKSEVDKVEADVEDAKKEVANVQKDLASVSKQINQIEVSSCLVHRSEMFMQFTLGKFGQRERNATYHPKAVQDGWHQHPYEEGEIGRD